MTTKIITVDGIQYDVRVTFDSMNRIFEIVEGTNTGTALTKRSIRDVIGTTYKYTMTVEPNITNPDAYDAFFEKISEPVDYHTISVPYGQDELTFEAQITGGSDVYKGRMGGKRRWGNMSVEFIPMEPQRT